MELYAVLNIFFQNTFFRLIRLSIFIFLTTLVAYQLLDNHHPKFSLFLLNILIIIEIFYRHKINKAYPRLTVDKNKGKNIYDSLTLPSAILLKGEVNTPAIINKLFRSSQVICFMQKTNMLTKDVPMQDIPKKILASSALDVARTFHGKFITTLDIFIAYLMLTEVDSKLLFAKQLKNEDLGILLPWIRLEYPLEETPDKRRFHFSGGGIGDFLITGWTPETQKYTRNFTSSALKAAPSIIGRETEFKNILEGLLKAENNNIILVGNSGSGKDNLVKAFAWHSFEGNLTPSLNNRHVLELMLGSLTAGTANRNELESRLQALIAEISHSGSVLLYIPDFQNIMGASSYDLNISGALMPYLESGELPIIASVTTENYKLYLQSNPMKGAFSVIELRSPVKEIALRMIMEKIKEIEQKNRLLISFRSAVSAVELADRFFHDQSLPGSAISLLQSVAGKVTLSKAPYFEHTRKKIVLEEHIVKYVEETARVVISMPDKKEIDTLLRLEDKLHERIISQQEAINAIAESMRRVRSGLSTSEKPVSFLFLGPTGVGKTETAKALSDLYYGGEREMIRLDMSEYTDEIGIRRLLGSPPGEGQERGELTDRIKDNPSALVLLDEFEKAHPKILDLFLQVFDDGRLTDNKGVTVSFRNCLIIATSNAGAEFIRQEVGKGTPVDKKFYSVLLDHLQSNRIFKPELLNRFDDIIVFKPLQLGDVIQVVNLFLKKIIKELDKQDIKLTIDDAIIERIASEGFDRDFGARPLSRYIRNNIEDLIAKKKLEGEITRGKKINIGIDGAGSIQLLVN